MRPQHQGTAGRGGPYRGGGLTLGPPGVAQAQQGLRAQRAERGLPAGCPGVRGTPEQVCAAVGRPARVAGQQQGLGVPQPGLGQHRARRELRVEGHGAK